MKRIFAVLAMVVAFGLIATQPANASSVSSTNSTPVEAHGEVESMLLAAQNDITPELFEEGLREIENSSVPRTVTVVGNETRTSYELPGGYGFTAVKTNSSKPISTPGVITPYLSVGSDSVGLYVYLNQFDQDAIISGGAFGIGLAICAIPGVGWVACAAVGAAMTAAALYLSYNGKCTNNRQLKAYIFVPERNRCV